MMVLVLGAVVFTAQVAAQDRSRVTSQDGYTVFPGTRHPTPENIPYTHLTLREAHNSDGTVRVFMDRANADSVVVGVNEGDRHEMFGKISDVDTDDGETLYIMDAQHLEVRALDFGGRYLGTFGGPGEGPGEFRFAREIAVSDRTVFVIDGRRISVFERQASSFALENTFLLDAPGMQGNCAMGGYLFTLGYGEGTAHVIHKMARDGRHAASFGDPYDSPNALVRLVMSANGLLACSEVHGVVAWIRSNVPVLTAFSGAGELLWRTKLVDFSPMGIVERINKEGHATVRHLSSAPGESFLHTLISDGEDHFYVGYFTFREGGHSENHLFKVDVCTGRGVYLGIGLVSAVSGSSIFLSLQNPFPRVIIYRHPRLDP